MPALGWVVAERWIAIEVIVAVTWASDAVDTADDDVCAQGVTGAEGSVGVVGGTDDLRAIVGDLSRCEGSRCREEDCLDEHVDFTLSKSESFVWLLR